jgi:type II secretion system protein J
MKTSCQQRAAFTLIEMMMAIAIFALVMSAIYSTWHMIIHATEVGQKSAAQAQRARVAIHTIEDSLTCVQSFQASMQYYSFIVQNGDSPVLSYTARVPEIFPRNSRFESNLRRLTFTLEGNGDSGHRLVLRQNPILMDMDTDEKTVPLILAYDVEKFKIECWDNLKIAWVDDWENTNSIPGLVRLSLRLGGRTETGRTVPVMDCVRIISIPSITLPSVAQNRAAGGPGGPGGLNPRNFGGVPNQIQPGQ